MTTTPGDTKVLDPHRVQRRMKEAAPADGRWTGGEEYVIVCACGTLVGARIDEGAGEDLEEGRRVLAHQRHTDHVTTVNTQAIQGTP